MCEELVWGERYLDDPLLAQLWLPVGAHRVQHHAVLPAAERGDLDHAHHLLRHRRHVRLAVRQRHQPLLPRAPVPAARVLEVPQGPHVQRPLVGGGSSATGQKALVRYGTFINVAHFIHKGNSMCLTTIMIITIIKTLNKKYNKNGDIKRTSGVS